MTAKQFIAGVIRSARENCQDVEKYFKSTQKMAADSSILAEIRELGRVIQRLLLCDRKVDVLSLPRELREIVVKRL